MHNMVIRSLVLNGELLLYLSFGAAGWLVLRYRFRHMPEKEKIMSSISNAFWLWIIVWKTSVFLFHPMEVIQYPLSLLYFDGGDRGIWIASLVVAIYIGRKGWKQSFSFSQRKKGGTNG